MKYIIFLYGPYVKKKNYDFLELFAKKFVEKIFEKQKNDPQVL